jgi:hypothetical protein
MSNDSAPRPSRRPDQRSLHEGCFAETLAELGWTPEYVRLDPAIPSAVVPVGVAGHNDRYVASPNYLHPELGCMLQDHVRGVYLIVWDVPTPREAAKLLAKHGISVEGGQPASWIRQQRSS